MFHSKDGVLPSLEMYTWSRLRSKCDKTLTRTSRCSPGGWCYYRKCCKWRVVCKVRMDQVNYLRKGGKEKVSCLGVLTEKFQEGRGFNVINPSSQKVWFYSRVSCWTILDAHENRRPGETCGNYGLRTISGSRTRAQWCIIPGKNHYAACSPTRSLRFVVQTGDL